MSATLQKIADPITLYLALEVQARTDRNEIFGWGYIKDFDGKITAVALLNSLNPLVITSRKDHSATAFLVGLLYVDLLRRRAPAAFERFAKFLVPELPQRDIGIVAGRFVSSPLAASIPQLRQGSFLFLGKIQNVAPPLRRANKKSIRQS